MKMSVYEYNKDQNEHQSWFTDLQHILINVC